MALTIALMHPGSRGVTPHARLRLQPNRTGDSELPKYPTSMGADATASCDGPALSEQANETPMSWAHWTAAVHIAV